MFKKEFMAVFLGVFAFVSIAPSVAKADEFTTDDIIVTANKREENVQEIPASISVLDSTTIEDFRIEAIEDVFHATPNMYMTKTGPSTSVTSFASIRGIAASMGGSPTLGVYVDGVYQPTLETNLLDIERIEVLRGPQGTLYGRNTEAGVINIITKNPTNYWEGMLGAEYGLYNTMNFKASVSGPIVEDTLFLRLSGNYKASDGYITNQFDDDEKVNKSKDLDLRFKLMTNPENDFRIALSADLQNYKTDGYADFAPYASADPFESVAVDYAGDSSKEGYNAALNVEYDFAKANLLSVSSFGMNKATNNNDMDFIAYDLIRLGVYNANTNFAEELRLASNDEDSPLQWLVGAYAFHEQNEIDLDIRVNYGLMQGLADYYIYDDVDTQHDTTGFALFTQESYTLWDSLELTVGLRYDYLNRSIDYTKAAKEGGYFAGEKSDNFNALLPKFALSYKVNENILPYFTVARGYREGGFNYNGNIGEKYESEFLWNYELGLKTQWLDDKLMANLNLFYIDWTDKIVEVTNGAEWYFDNAAAAKSQGIEAELIYAPIVGLKLMANFGYTDAEYTDYTAGGVDFSDNKLADTPLYTASLGGTYRFFNGIFLGANYNRYGKIYYDRANDNVQEDYNLLDLKVGYEKEHFEVYAYANNVLDETYFTRVVDGSAGGVYGRLGTPRTFGIALTGKF